MQVRTLQFSDFLKLGRMRQANIGLNLPYALVIPDTPLPAALTQHLPVNTVSSSVYICEENGKPQAYAQARARQRRDEWEVLSLGVVGNVHPEAVEPNHTGSGKPGEAAGDLPAHPGNLAQEPSAVDSDSTANPEVEAYTLAGSEAEPEVELPEQEIEYINNWPVEIESAWLKLLEHMVVDAGEKGVVRLYARLSIDSPQLELFSQTGFHAYTHENLFFLPYTHPLERPVSANLKLKEQRNRDAWFIQQLYAAITPSFVQNSEQATSRTWEIHRGYLPRPTKETGWVLLEADKAVAYIRVLSHRHRHLLRIMNLDSRREILPDLIRYALSTLKAGPETQVYCAVREYQMEQEAILEEAGFQYGLGKQAVLVKHTVQFVRSTERQLVRGREGKLELARSAIRPDLVVRLVKFMRKSLKSLVAF